MDEPRQLSYYERVRWWLSVGVPVGMAYALGRQTGYRRGRRDYIQVKAQRRYL